MLQLRDNTEGVIDICREGIMSFTSTSLTYMILSESSLLRVYFSAGLFAPSIRSFPSTASSTVMVGRTIASKRFSFRLLQPPRKETVSIKAEHANTIFFILNSFTFFKLSAAAATERALPIILNLHLLLDCGDLCQTIFYTPFFRSDNDDDMIHAFLFKESTPHIIGRRQKYSSFEPRMSSCIPVIGRDIVSAVRISLRNRDDIKSAPRLKPVDTGIRKKLFERFDPFQRSLDQLHSLPEDESSRRTCGRTGRNIKPGRDTSMTFIRLETFHPRAFFPASREPLHKDTPSRRLRSRYSDHDR